jgi:hypothetical protein
MKNKKLYLLFLLFLLCLSSNTYGEEKENKGSIIINFKQGKYEVLNKDLFALLNKLDKSKKYKIGGYSCKEDGDSDEEKLGGAGRRAEAAGKIIKDHGIPGENITTVAYGESSECKAVIIEIDNKYISVQKEKNINSQKE